MSNLILNLDELTVIKDLVQAFGLDATESRGFVSLDVGDLYNLLIGAKEIRIQQCRMENICKKYPYNSDLSETERKKLEQKITADLERAFSDAGISSGIGVFTRLIVVAADYGLTLQICDCICSILIKHAENCIWGTIVLKKGDDAKEMRITVVDVYKQKKLQ